MLKIIIRSPIILDIIFLKVSVCLCGQEAEFGK